jgi:hypothetical protein
MKHWKYLDKISPSISRIDKTLAEQYNFMKVPEYKYINTISMDDFNAFQDGCIKYWVEERYRQRKTVLPLFRLYVNTRSQDKIIYEWTNELLVYLEEILLNDEQWLNPENDDGLCMNMPLTLHQDTFIDVDCERPINPYTHMPFSMEYKW